MPQLRRQLPPLASLAPFEAAGRHLSFSRAAAELSLTQAAVSRQIRALEESLGVRLFHRKRYGVALTEQGAELAAEIGPALQQIAAASERARASARKARTVSLFCDIAIGGSFVIPLISAVRRDHPDLAIRLVTSSEQLEMTAETFDVGLATGRLRGERFDVVEICAEQIFPVASPALARALPLPLAPRDLLAQPLLHFAQPGRDWVDWTGFLAFHGVSSGRFDAFPFTSYSVLLDAAEAGHGIALGWKLSVENRLKLGTLVRLEGLTMPLERGLAAYLPKRRARPEPVVRFLDWLIAHARG
jgi:DNA-binding transcriptional LysR family regulator